MLLKMAIGDAYGAGFEFAPKSIVDKYNDGKKYNNRGNPRITLGHYTDDTQMSLALSELILSDLSWTKVNIAQTFLDVFHRDERKGYASNFYKLLKRTESGEKFLECIIPTSDKSGAAMRSAPLGYFPYLKDVIKKTKIQASVTHNTKGGINSALAVAIASHYFIYELGDKKDLGTFINDYIPGCWEQPWQGPVSVSGIECTQAAISAIRSCDSFTELLIHCVAFTGDTDTVACIAFGIASHCNELKQDLSEKLYSNLENDEYGRDYLCQIDKKLMNKFLPLKTKTR